MLFDMDGTLVDSERLWDVALFALADRCGGVLSEPVRRAMVGRNVVESVAMLYDDIGQPDQDPVAGAAWVEDRMVDLLATELVWRPGAAELLAQARSVGLPTALVTSTVRPLVEVALDTLGRSHFDTVICGDEVVHGKPHPEPYLTAAARLRVPVDRCIAVEDSPTGIASARAAGAVVIGVPHDVALADVDGVAIVGSLAELDIDRLFVLAAAARAAL